MSPQAQRLQQAIDEARMILAQHDGMHHLHSDAAALVILQKCAEMGIAIDEADVEVILQRMRRCAITGKWSL